MKLAVNKVQIARRFVQCAVVAAILIVPVVSRYTNYLSAHELQGNLQKWEGTAQGEALGAVDFVVRSLPDGEVKRAGEMQRNRTRILEYTKGLRGGVWSAEVAGVSMTDPLAVAENLAASRTWSAPLLVGLLIPLALTLMLGRVFCSWICPVGLLLELTDKARGLLSFLEIKPRSLRFPRSFKYVILAGGLLIAAISAVPVLGYIYPPAIVSRELHDFVLALYDRAEFGRFGLSTEGLTVMSLAIVAIVLFEVLVSRRWWCRYVCPGGALYNILGWARPVRVKLRRAACTGCAMCVPACPMGLNPMQNKMGIECDNCGVCIASCGDDALAYGFSAPTQADEDEHAVVPVERLAPAKRSAPAERLEGRTLKAARHATTVTLALALLLGSAAPASAHHILGIPHYSYEEDYPQTPVLTFAVEAGPYDVKVTGYPGELEAGDQCSLYVYVKDRESGLPYDGEVTALVRRKGMLTAGEVIYGPITVALDESVYKFYPRFEREAEYMAEVSFGEAGHPWIIDLPMVVGEPSSPWAPIVGAAGAALVFAVGLRAALIKRRRRLSAVHGRPEDSETMAKAA